jgi:hypothetical protein
MLEVCKHPCYTERLRKTWMMISVPCAYRSGMRHEFNLLEKTQ